MPELCLHRTPTLAVPACETLPAGNLLWEHPAAWGNLWEQRPARDGADVPALHRAQGAAPTDRLADR